MKVLFVSSSGGHWVQMMRTRRAFEGHELFFASTERSYNEHNPTRPFHYIPDASRWNKFKLIWQAIIVASVVIRVRPKVVITTGASAGFFAIAAAKVLGARTIWLDSIANTAQMSLSGQKAGRFADLYLTQWPDLAEENGPHYLGTVL